jgi:hypothetical protein
LHHPQQAQARQISGLDSADYDKDGWRDLFVTSVDEDLFIANGHPDDKIEEHSAA